MIFQRLTRVILVAVVPATVPAATLLAQCPDGTPPPCRGAAPAAVRRPPPPLDDRTWIVVPFENVARVADIDWLKDASVNLLYLDMSKWRDIRVIDDERVADLIREVPEARGGSQLSLQSGIAVARRAGAGKLVMGDLLKVGARTQIVGKVFDVRTGQRLRTVRQEATNSDSIMGAFGQLARGVLNVAPPAGTSLGTIGTTSVGAYQAYLAGVGFLNRWLLDSAHAQFTKALAFDSTFALAHYKLALVYGWESPGLREGPRHADQALRLGGNLPPRERNLVTGYAAFANNRWADACRIFEAMIRTDSLDVEAWYNFGECNYHDLGVLPVGGDTTRLAFRSSWNTMLRAFRKSLELDPTYHLAFQHIQDALLTGARPGCRINPGETQCAPQSGGLGAVIRRAGDSLVTVPVNAASLEGAREQTTHQVEAGITRVRHQNLLEARRAAEDWLAAAPGETRPRVAYTRILLRLGQVRAADSVSRLVEANRTSTREGLLSLIDRFEIAFKLGNAAEAVRIADSLRVETDSVRTSRNAGIILASMVGKLDGLASLTNAVQGPEVVKRYFRLQLRSFAGLQPDSLFEAEKSFSDMVAGTQGASRAAGITAATILFVDPRTRAGRWPVMDTSSNDPRIALMSVIALGDSARSRRALAKFDSVATSFQDEPDNGMALVGAYGHLMVSDTAGALAILRRFRDVTWFPSSALDQVGPGFTFQGMLWPRALLLLADLAAARGHKTEAAQAYRLFIGMWDRGDSEVQPIVGRARQALAGLGG
jgi:eukaryotic-like serine/threonine-protein kinase